MNLTVDNQPGGIYVHVPFCARLCPYCDFAVAVRKTPDFAGYVDAVSSEYRARAAELDAARVETLYFGGGTPSLLPPAEFIQLANLFDDLRPQFTEVTIEANPASVDAARLNAWNDAGVTRISLGVQSFSNRLLKALGRNHDRERALKALQLCLEQDFDVSLDLIFSGPGHNLEDIARDVNVLRDFPDLNHVSAYQLTVEPNTVFGNRAARGELELPDEDASSDSYDALRDALNGLGFEQYEVSSHARAGKLAVHNRNYWLGRSYFGLGTGAFSFGRVGEQIVRRANPRSLKQYQADPTVADMVEVVDLRDYLRERLFLSVRHSGGLSLGNLRSEFGLTLSESEWTRLRELTDQMAAQGLLRADESGRYAPTREGFALADSVAEVLWRFDLDDLGRPTSS